MTASRIPSAYDTWQVGPARVDDLTVQVASKPGVFAHGGVDAPALMLAEGIARLGQPEQVTSSPATSLHLGSGNGLVPAVAQAVGFAPVACDRYMGNVEAARRTLQASAAALGTAAGVVHHTALANPFVAAGTCDMVSIRIPTDKLGVQQAVAEAFRALRVGGTCLLAGANDEGVKPAARLLEQAFGATRLEAQHSGCRLLVATKQADVPSDPASLVSPWLDAAHFHTYETQVAGRSLTVVTRPGVFSWEHLDEASGILAGVMRIEPTDVVLDLGCGTGVLGVVAAAQATAGRVIMVDADADAVRCATRTAAVAGCTNVDVRASDVAAAIDREADTPGGRGFDVVVSNPPFHLGKGTELAIPRAFIEQSYAQLASGGRLYLVANRTLPYERLIAECFGEVRTAHDGRRFKVIGAVKRG